MQRNEWSQWSGMGGHNAAEWVVTMVRNGWSQCSGIRNDDVHKNYAEIFKQVLNKKELNTLETLLAKVLKEA